MDVGSYCESLKTQLVGWKANLYDMLKKLDQLPQEAKQKVAISVDDLQDLVKEIQEGASELQRECPSDWSTQRADLEKKVSQLNEKWQEVWAEMSMVSPDDYE